jgi:hypothetical protein
MLRVLASSAVDCGCEHALVKAKTIKLVFAASPLRMYHVEARSKRLVNRNTNILSLLWYNEIGGCIFITLCDA